MWAIIACFIAPKASLQQPNIKGLIVIFTLMQLSIHVAQVLSDWGVYLCYTRWLDRETFVGGCWPWGKFQGTLF
jgi:hypothetical protein